MSGESDVEEEGRREFRKKGEWKLMRSVICREGKEDEGMEKE